MSNAERRLENEEVGNHLTCQKLASWSQSFTLLSQNTLHSVG
jgi:hypothetical protein